MREFLKTRDQFLGTWKYLKIKFCGGTDTIFEDFF